jgi:predicted HAD superfamily Cof-like phosphohydrolase
MSYFEDVVRWHLAIGDPVEPCSLSPDDFKDHELSGNRLAFGVDLVTEEYQEMIRAYVKGDMLELADAGADLVWVVCGLMARMGIDLDTVWNEVRRANFDKLGGPIRSDGKRLKPEGWRPPDITAALLQAPRNLRDIR